MSEDIDAIVRGLSIAQQEYLTTLAKWKQPTAYSDHRWMTSPPANTHRVLIAKGMCDGVGQILPLGLRVRARLEQERS